MSELSLILAFFAVLAGVVVSLVREKIQNTRVRNGITVLIIAASVFVGWHVLYQEWYLKPKQNWDTLVAAAHNAPIEFAQLVCPLDQFGGDDLNNASALDDLFKPDARTEVRVSSRIRNECTMYIGIGPTSLARANRLHQALVTVFRYRVWFP